MSYQLTKIITNPVSGETSEGDSIKRIADGAFIPKDPANTDYQEYLEWVEEGNTAEAAD
tara:strand:+ start:1033 stop:1209 length:177 start_codon:yes stop_codon:yes gene_type:complete